MSARCRSAPEAPPRSVGPRAAPPAKEYDVTGTFDSLAQHLHRFSPLKWRRRGHPIERSSWKAITDFAAQHAMASDCVPHQIMDLAAQHGITVPLASAQFGTIRVNQSESE